MKYTDNEIRDIILDHVYTTEQAEIMYIIPFCLGFFGYITNQIWRVIRELIKEEAIYLSRTDEP